MKIFAIDCSTPEAGICLMDGHNVVTEADWVEERSRHEILFERAELALHEAGWRWEEIDLFAVGRGPGAYSGLRVSLLAVQALAAADRRIVTAVSSMEALALRLMREEGLDEITIAGDARRDSIWYGVCRADRIGAQPAEWKVAPRTESATVLAGNGVIATPHWAALDELREKTGAVRWLRDGRTPAPRDVAELAVLRIREQARPEPVVPLYLHPAV